MSITVLLVSLAVSRGAEEERLLEAIRFVESGGREVCPDGDEGQSIGPFQICDAYWRDAVEFEPTLGGSYEDCRDREYATKVVRAYMKRYAPRAWQALDAETIARVHNGGPRGPSKTSTRVYWRRVRAALGSQPSPELVRR